MSVNELCFSTFVPLNIIIIEPNNKHRFQDKGGIVTKISKSIFAAALFIASPAQAKKDQAPIDPGPPPTSVEEFQRLATAAILARFFDPGAAQISWDRGLTGGYWKPVLSKKIPGWFTCGMVNGKNRMGGYVGARRFVAVYYSGQIVYSEVGDGSTYDFVRFQCEKAISTGVIPPAGTGPVAAAPDPNTPRMGIGFDVVPDGAYILAVEPSSSAAEAGIVPGMVISHVNAVPVKGFDKGTTTKILQAPSDTLTLTIIGKGDVIVHKRLP